MNFNAIDAIQEIYMDLPHDHIRFIINELCKKGVEIYSQIVRISPLYKLLEKLDIPKKEVGDFVRYNAVDVLNLLNKYGDLASDDEFYKLYRVIKFNDHDGSELICDLSKYKSKKIYKWGKIEYEEDGTTHTRFVKRMKGNKNREEMEIEDRMDKMFSFNDSCFTTIKLNYKDLNLLATLPDNYYFFSRSCTKTKKVVDLRDYWDFDDYELVDSVEVTRYVIALNAVGYNYFDLIFYEFISEPFNSGEVYGVFVDTCNYNFDILTHSFLNFKD